MSSPVECNGCGKIDYTNYPLWVKAQVIRHEGPHLRAESVELCEECRFQVPPALQAKRPEWFEKG